MKQLLTCLIAAVLIAVSFVCLGVIEAAPVSTLISMLPFDQTDTGLLMFGIGMTTLAANSPRAYEQGDRDHLPVIASDIIYEGGAIGIVKGTGHARPLAAGDLFGGMAVAKADNSAGAAAAIYVEAQRKGQVQLSVSGAVITDVGQPVYATDDDTFVFLPTGAVFIGFVKRFVSSGIVVVEYDLDHFIDPYAAYGGVYETLAAATLTLDIQDNGKVFFCTVTTVITLPAVATPVNCTVVCMGPYGTVQVSMSPNAADGMHMPDIGYVDNKDYINTLATAQRGDFVTIRTGDANGWVVANQHGVWAKEA